MKPYFVFTVFIVSTTILLLNRYTPLYINNTIVHFIFLLLAATSFTIVIGSVLFKSIKTWHAKFLILLLVTFICLLKAFTTWSGDWMTQTILYRNRQNDRKTIEFQMRGDRFSFGYKKRIVGRMKIIPWIDWTTDIDTTAIDTLQWKRVNEQINELGLKNYQFFPGKE